MIIDEMIEFYRKQKNLTQAEIQKEMEESPFVLAKTWQERNPSTAEEVNKFYEEVDYIAELLRYHNLESRRNLDLDIMIEVRGRHRQARVLDYGCGTGIIGFMLKDAMPGLIVDLYDLPSPAHEFARAFNVFRPRPIEFVNTFVIQRNRYDFIICNDVLEHLPDEELESTIDFLQSRLASPYSKIFAQVGFYHEPHVIPMHFDWTEKRCEILRKVMRWEFWEINLDFLNLVMKGKLRPEGKPALSADIKPQPTSSAAAGNSCMPPANGTQHKPVAAPPSNSKPGQDCGKTPVNGANVSHGAIATPPASSAPPKPAGPAMMPNWPAPEVKRVNITKRGVLYVGFPCNIKCKFCYYAYHESKEWHSLEECKRDASLFRQKYGNRFVDITGGEPTIYPHILDLMDHCNAIGIKPTLITNVQALANEDRVKAFKDHGVNDFLCSVHAIGEAYNDLTQSKQGWKRLNQGIENLNRHDIAWRANCTMTKLNMKQFKEIADWIKERNARIVNFINFNPFEEWQSKMDIDFQARHAELSPYLVDVLDHCDRIGLEANVRYFPFCHMRGHEEKCINFQQLSYDPNEWDFCSWYAPETRAPSDKLPDSVLMAATNEEELHRFIAQSQKKRLYVQNSGCLQCAHMFICDGFTHQYYSRFGIGEAKPYAGAPILDPTLFIAKREGSAYTLAGAQFMRTHQASSSAVPA